VSAAAALTLLLAAAPKPGGYPLACAYGSRTEGLDHAEACAVDTSDGLVLAPAVLAQLAYERGLASIGVVGRGWYYRRTNGRTQLMVTFETEPDYFREGLARALVSGRLAYVDRRLRVRIATRFDWGEPFEHGRAAVCVGCVERKVDGGEHSVMVGGRWGVIDRHGREVVPLTERRSGG
jgi:hypothetical protein